MRFMMIMIPNVSEEDWKPDAEAIAAMGKYNDELNKAGILLALDGLHPTADGARVAFGGGKPSVTDGPFTEAKEAAAGFALVEVTSQEEAIELTRRFRAIVGDGESVIQQVFGP